MTTYIYAFLSVIVVSLVSFVGVLFLSLKEETLQKYVHILISLAVGALLGDAFVHLIPQSLKDFPNGMLASVLIIVGILIFFILEKFLHWHHHGDDADKDHVHPVGKLVLFTDGVHNFIDGIIIGASFLVSIPIGIATTLAVVLHEIPQEIGDFAVLVHAGYSKKRALWLNFISALTAILGTAFVFIFGNFAQNSIIWFLPIAAGGFIYIAVADLIPELQKTRNLKYSVFQILTVIIGVGLIAILELLE